MSTSMAQEPRATKPSTTLPEVGAELEKRVPRTGIFNETMIGAVSAGFFGFLGFHAFKWIGKLGDDSRQMKTAGRFETGLKWIGALGAGFLAAAVAIRHAREAKAQAIELAKRSLELEQHNAALSSVTSRPVGTLIENLDSLPSERFTPVPASLVSEAKASGTLVEPSAIQKM